jgi:integrase
MATYERRERNGQITYRVRYRDPGDNNAKSITCPDEKTAKVKCGDIERHHLLSPGEPYPRDGRRSDAMLMDVAAAWLRDLVRLGKADRTIRVYSYAVEGYVRHVAAGGDVDRVRASALSRSSVEAWDAATATAGRGASARRGRLVAVGLMWRWASERADEYPGIPPFVRVDVPSVQVLRVKSPTWTEMDAAIGSLDAGSPEYRTAMIARSTGLRVEQILAIRWDHVDLMAGILFVASGKSAQEKRGREVPIAPSLVQEMATWPRPGALVVGSTYNVVQPRIKLGWTIATARGQCRAEVWAASERTGRTVGCPLHAFRHGFVSGLKRAGCDDEAVEYLVGHADAAAAKGTRGSYVDADALSLAAVVANVPAYVAPSGPSSNVIPMIAATA